MDTDAALEELLADLQVEGGWDTSGPEALGLTSPTRATDDADEDDLPDPSAGLQSILARAMDDDDDDENHAPAPAADPVTISGTLSLDEVEGRLTQKPEQPPPPQPPPPPERAFGPTTAADRQR